MRINSNVMSFTTMLIFFLIIPIETTVADEAPSKLIFGCAADNDLYRVVTNNGIESERYDTPEAAIQAAPSGSSLLILAENYPDNTTKIDDVLYALVKKKNLRLYIEYPSYIPDYEIKKPQHIQYERGVITSDAFGEDLKKMRIVMIHDCSFVPLAAKQSHIVIARVAGFDTAVYGLEGTHSHPILFKHPKNEIMIATTKLSQFVTARYAPKDAWLTIWQMVINWLQPGLGNERLHWESHVRPLYGRNEKLSPNVERYVLGRGVDWFIKSKMLLHPAACPRYDTDSLQWVSCSQKESDLPSGDGRLGVLEGISSRIAYDGSQKIVWWRRNDCNGEVAGAFALAGVILDKVKYRQTAQNILNFMYSESIMSLGDRQDPQHPAFGLVGWNDIRHYHEDLNGYAVYYGDDNARALLGTIAAAAALNINRWDERIMQCLLANLRTTGELGFRKNRIDEKPLNENGWEYYSKQPIISYAPHYQAYLWACYLWAYAHTGYKPFLEKARNAIRMTIEAYPHAWHWTNGMQQERARMILPLAWLVRVEDSPLHRQWLKEMARELLIYQDSCGAIREALGEAGHGSYEPPESNEAYGTSEAPLIQSNGDKVCDLLYTTNFALLGLHEAAAATGDPYYHSAEDKLINFLCKIQIYSKRHPELDGGWFRAFDFNRWEYWASNADLGWGAWCIETGWTQGWINMILALRQLNQSLWDISANSEISRWFEKNRKVMIPKEK